MAKKKSITVPVLPAPQNATQADNVLHVIGQHKRALDALVLKREEAVAAAAEKFAKSIADAAEALQANVDSLQAYAEANKDELLKDGKRSVTFMSGMFGWRYGNPALKYDADDEADLIARLRRLKLDQHIRTTETLDKQSLLASPDDVEAINGIEIEQVERFFVLPLELTDDIAGKARKLKGAAATIAPDPAPKKAKAKGK